MMVSRFNFKILLLIILLLLCPVGASYAQDFEAVERKLGEAVAEGHLSLKQALVMMEALRRSSKKQNVVRHKKEHVSEQIEQWVKKVSLKIKAAAKSGEITEKEAWLKWQAFKDNQLGPKLRAAFKQGLVSERWIKDLKRGIEAAEVGDMLKSAVTRGELTEAQAKKKWLEYQEYSHSKTALKAKSNSENAELLQQFAAFKVSQSQLKEMKFYLAKVGFEPEEISFALGAVLELLQSFRKTKEFDIDLKTALLHKFGRYKLRAILRLAKQVLDFENHGIDGSKALSEELVEKYQAFGVGVDQLKDFQVELNKAHFRSEHVESALAVVLRLAYQIRKTQGKFTRSDVLNSGLLGSLKLDSDQVDSLFKLAHRTLSANKQRPR